MKKVYSWGYAQRIAEKNGQEYMRGTKGENGSPLQGNLRSSIFKNAYGGADVLEQKIILTIKDGLYLYSWIVGSNNAVYVVSRSSERSRSIRHQKDIVFQSEPCPSYSNGEKCLRYRILSEIAEKFTR